MRPLPRLRRDEGRQLPVHRLRTTKCKFDAIHLKKVRDWHAGSYETMPIKVAEGVVKRAGSIVKKAVSK